MRWVDAEMMSSARGGPNAGRIRYVFFRND